MTRQIPHTFLTISSRLQPRLLCNSPNRFSKFQFPASEYFVSSLETCSDIKSLRNLHACIISSGLQNHIFLSSKLVHCYAHFKSLPESRKVFNGVKNKTLSLSLWNSTLIGYYRTGYYEEGLKLYVELKQKKIGVDSSTITFCLKCCTELGDLEFGRGIHGDSFKYGVSDNRFVGSSLIGLYSKYEDIDVARKVFDEMSDKDVIGYTTMVTGYVKVDGDGAYEAFKIVGDMQEKGFEPNRVTLVSLLQIAGRLEEVGDGRSIHAYAIRREIGCFDEVFNTCLVDMYLKCGVPHAAELVFSKMNTKSLASWNAFIAGHLQIGKPSIALDLLGCMVLSNIKPDLITLSNGLLSCAALRFLLQGKIIHAYILRSKYQLDLVAATALIDMYSKCNSIKQAREVFLGMKARDAILFNVMIAGYVWCMLVEKALETFHGMVKAGIKPNLATILSILSASAQLTDLRVGKSIHGYVVRKELGFHTEIANQILYMYAKWGQVDVARQVFSRITRRDLISWTSMMMGYVNLQFADETIKLFHLMQEAKMKPDSVTLISLLQAFSQLGCINTAKEIHCYIYRTQLEKEIPVVNSLAITYAKCGRLDMSKLVFEDTRRPALTSWNTMIAAYGMHGHCMKALALFNRMQDENVKPDELTFTSLISACSHAGMVEEGQRLFYAMKVEHSVVPRDEHYGTMVDLFARAGRLKEAYDLVKCIPWNKSASALAALLSACKVYRNADMGELVGKQLLDLEPDNSVAYTLLSNIYAEAGKWDQAARLRETANLGSVNKVPGYSMIEFDQKVVRREPFVH
ncbi:hypothetical protein ACHQM5_006482 [Ranunculus cassubicifolius]